MQRIILLFILALLVIPAVPHAKAQAHSETYAGTVGDLFPDFTVEGDLSPEQLAYLDAAEPKVQLTSIKAEYLLIEVFSMYCPICQREAPQVNDLYAKTRKYDGLRMIGIATGNTPFETNFFRDQYNVPFPLFHDEHFVVNDGLGHIGTPYFVFVKNTGTELQTLLIHEGAVEDWDGLWADIKKAAGL